VDLSELGEFGFLDRVRDWIGPSTAPVGFGDDAAVVDVGDGRHVVAAADAFVEGNHFRWEWSSPADVGWKSIVANISDVAAMGAVPRWALVSLGLPAATKENRLRGLYEGMAEACLTYGCELIGGDTVRADQTFVAVTILGEIDGKPMVRSQARVGDALAVTGPLGRAAAGLNLLFAADPGNGPDVPACITAQLRPSARVEDGVRLRAAGVRAALDVSDGLASDALRMAEASGVGVEITELPIAPEAARIAGARGWDAQAMTLYGGEDYELLAAVPDGVDCDLIRVGRVVEEGMWLVHDGRRESLPEAGHDHFRGR
jgi:thiamine-monophosphate kinase